MKKRAFALPLVLWAVAFLAGLSVLLLTSVSHWIDEEALAERRFAARQNAISGLAFGMNPAIEVGDPLLITGNEETDGFAVRITDESARLNPNYWMLPERRKIFETLFSAWEVEKPAQDGAIDAMADWMDPDDFLSLNGAERAQYEERGLVGFPPNGPLISVAEMEAVIGLQDILAGQENWRDHFTVMYQGKISILHTTAPLLAALSGITPEQADEFLQLRAGEDGIDGNADDTKFSSIDDVASVLGVSSLQAALLDEYFTVDGGQMRRIESTGWAAGSSYRIAAVVDGNNLLSWEEK